MVTVMPYGSWPSPITPADVAAADGAPSWVEVHDGEAWWAESRPDEGGRVALLREGRLGEPVEVLGPPWNVRNRVHEYGGRPWTLLPGVGGAPTAVFTNWDDQRMYALAPGGQPRPISPEPARPQGYRYAEPVAAPDGGEVWCVRETVTGDAPTDIRRELVALPVSGEAAGDPAAVRVLGASHRFLPADLNARLVTGDVHLRQGGRVGDGRRI